MLPSEYQRHDEIDAETASQYHRASRYQDEEVFDENYDDEAGLSALQETRQDDEVFDEDHVQTDEEAGLSALQEICQEVDALKHE